MKLKIILVRPSVAENIGAVARILKNMGLEELRLVSPLCELKGKAEWVAHGARDILQNAVIFSNLGNALSDIDFSVATTAKKRKRKADNHLPEKAIEIIFNKKTAINTAAIVFGNESHGLNDHEISLCNIISTIPMHTAYPSLNLSHAVMIFAYEYFKFQKAQPSGKECTTDKGFKSLMLKAEEILNELEISKNKNLHNRIMERLSLLDETDIHLMLSVFDRYFRTKQLK
ncbi:MAG: tRNA/rRNA methyltransferase [Sphingobacteriales bacterium]|nr:tRNA/rRNA methyltransferase [Sphingobacteriales bacterium]